MPKYYCDYCDIYLTHDSPSVRKSHNEGWKHKAAVKAWYSQFIQDATQDFINERIKEFELRGDGSGLPRLPGAPPGFVLPPGMDLPPGFPAPPPGFQLPPGFPAPPPGFQLPPGFPMPPPGGFPGMPGMPPGFMPPGMPVPPAGYGQ